MKSDVSLTGSLAVGIIILGVAFEADLHNILCEDLSHLFNLCKQPPDTILLGVSRVRDIIEKEEPRYRCQ